MRIQQNHVLASVLWCWPSGHAPFTVMGIAIETMYHHAAPLCYVCVTRYREKTQCFKACTFTYSNLFNGTVDQQQVSIILIHPTIRSLSDFSNHTRSTLNYVATILNFYCLNFNLLTVPLTLPNSLTLPTHSNDSLWTHTLIWRTQPVHAFPLLSHTPNSHLSKCTHLPTHTESRLKHSSHELCQLMHSSNSRTPPNSCARPLPAYIDSRFSLY